MKQLFKITLITICIFIFSQCKDDDDQSDKPNYGAQYFKCKINGFDFISQSTFHCDGGKFDYYPEAYLTVPAGYMLIRGRNCLDYESTAIRINGMQYTTGNLNFLNPAFADSIFPFYLHYNDSDSVRTLYETLIEGEMNIEQFIPRADDRSPYGTIKGTFNYILTDEHADDTIRITDGRFRFDVKQIF